MNKEFETRHGQNRLDVINGVLKSESSGIYIVGSGGLASFIGAQRVKSRILCAALAATLYLNVVDLLQRVHPRSLTDSCSCRQEVHGLSCTTLGKCASWCLIGHTHTQTDRSTFKTEDLKSSTQAIITITLLLHLKYLSP